jgi:peptide/nickel transport system ATP-binding protein
MEDLRYDIRIAAGKRNLVDIRDFRVARGRITFLFGESGIGKSLIARAIYGLLDPDDLDVTVNGETYRRYAGSAEAEAIRKNGFFVFQEPSSHLNPLLRLGEQLREGSLAAAEGETELLRGLWDSDARGQIEGLLRVYPKPHRPSGGEKQRMFLAMALKKIDMVLGSGDDAGAGQALFVFDEPTGSLDNRARDTFLSLLFRRYRRKRCTMLVITHDYSMISELARAYPDLRGDIVLRELRRANDGLELRAFRAETYLDWLQAREKGSGKAVPRGQPVLRVASPIGVFGRTLTITRDPEGKQEAALELFPGTLAYLKAPSGVGKTTLMKVLMGVIPCEQLSMELEGLAVSSRSSPSLWRKAVWGRRMTMVFQHADEALNPRSTVRGVFEGLPGKIDNGTAALSRRLAELFEGEIDPRFLDTPVSALSGGQKQRLNLARGLALQTGVLLLDEPLNGLDFESSTRVIGLLERKQAAGIGILMVSHNEEIVETMVSRDDLYYLHVS